MKVAAEISASWNLCLASVSVYMKTGKWLMQKQPKVNISDERSST